MRHQSIWGHSALSFAMLADIAGAVATSPPEKAKRQAAVTAVSECHMHDTVQYCMAGTAEYRILATTTDDLPSSYTACHAHATETWCMNPSGGEVQVVAAAIVTGPPAAATGSPTITAVTDCHMHGSDVFCLADATEYRVETTLTATQDLPPAYTGCHSHGSDTYCLSPSGDDVQISLASEEDEGNAEEAAGENCHFHAGVEHCVGAGGERGPVNCERTDREYNIPLRIGLLFAILVTSAMGVFAPIVLAKYLDNRANTILLIVKQFGTGVILSTSLVHLFTHAELMFGNECLGELEYEATTAAIVMAGLFLSFLVEYLGCRFVKWRACKEAGSPVPTAKGMKSIEMMSIYVMEAGIIFHSLVIGLTLVVAGDSFLLTLFVVIIFHQMFEGLALGSCIAALGTGGASPGLSMLGHAHGGHGHSHSHAHAHVHTHTHAHADDYTKNGTDSLSPDNTTSKADTAPPSPPLHPETATTITFRVPTAKKILLAVAFALVTPVGMAIGIGVLDVFNGNDPQTIVAIGTLDAFSAGILLWVGVVEMWAADWVFGGALTDADARVTGMGLGAMVAGMVAMNVLGKWA